MASVNDVAAYVLSEGGRMSAMKLQKLVYYSQAWHLVWEDEPLFESRIEAWANGPVCPELYRQHRGTYLLADWPGGDPESLLPHEAETVDTVLASYGQMTAEELSRLTHSELPWAEARTNLSAGARGNVEIDQLVMADFYGGLYESPESFPVMYLVDPATAASMFD